MKREDRRWRGSRRGIRARNAADFSGNRAPALIVGRPPGPRPTPSSACRGCRKPWLFERKSGSRGTRADQAQTKGLPHEFCKHYRYWEKYAALRRVRAPPPSIQAANSDITEPSVVAVVLQRDRTVLARLLGQIDRNRRTSAPTPGDAFRRERRIQVRLHQLHAVQPVLDMIAFHHQACLVELAHRPRDILRRTHDIVQRARLVARSHPRVGVARIVEDLVFEAHYIFLPMVGPFGRTVLHREIDEILEAVRRVVREEYAVLDAILDSAVGAGRHLPLPRQFEIAEHVLGEQVFGDVRAAIGLQAAIVDGPGVAGWNFLPRIAPARHGRAVEKTDPSGLRQAGQRCSQSGAQTKCKFHAGDPFCLSKILPRIFTAVSTSRSVTM